MLASVVLLGVENPAKGDWLFPPPNTDLPVSPALFREKVGAAEVEVAGAAPKGFEAVGFAAEPKMLGPEAGAEVADVFEPKRLLVDAGFTAPKSGLLL